MSQRITYNEFSHVCKTLSILSEHELCEIYWKIHDNQWDDRLGEKPENFDELPIYADKWYQRLFKAKSKTYYLDPYRCGIRALIGHDGLYDFYNIHIAKAPPELAQAARDNRAKERARMERDKRVHDALISWGYIK